MNPGPNITSTLNLDQAGMEINPSAAASGDGKQVGKTPASLVGFWGSTPIAQPSATAGNVHTPTVGSTTAVFVNTTFDGSVGTKAYTIGDIVIALKAAGLLAT